MRFARTRSPGLFAQAEPAGHAAAGRHRQKTPANMIAKPWTDGIGHADRHQPAQIRFALRWGCLEPDLCEFAGGGPDSTEEHADVETQRHAELRLSISSVIVIRIYILEPLN
jgi:hypothetical protein